MRKKSEIVDTEQFTEYKIKLQFQALPDLAANKLILENISLYAMLREKIC